VSENSNRCRYLDFAAAFLFHSILEKRRTLSDETNMAEAKRFAGRSVEARVCLQHAQEAETQAELERLRKLDEV
jgi:hypothetical protein